MASEFTKKYGIEVNTLTGRPTELLARMFGEERTGRPTVDIIATGNQLSIELKARNVIFPLDNVLISLDVLDSNKWFGGLPWSDPRCGMQDFWQTNHGIWRNAKLVGDSEIKEFNDPIQVVVVLVLFW